MPTIDIELARYLKTRGPDADAFYSTAALANAMMELGFDEDQLNAELIKWAARALIRTSTTAEFEVTQRGHEVIDDLVR